MKLIRALFVLALISTFAFAQTAPAKKSTGKADNDKATATTPAKKSDAAAKDDKKDEKKSDQKADTDKDKKDAKKSGGDDDRQA